MITDISSRILRKRRSLKSIATPAQPFSPALVASQLELRSIDKRLTKSPLFPFERDFPSALDWCIKYYFDVRKAWSEALWFNSTFAVPFEILYISCVSLTWFLDFLCTMKIVVFMWLLWLHLNRNSNHLAICICKAYCHVQLTRYGLF